MAGPSHSPFSTEMSPWIMRDFPHWTYLNDPCLENGTVTKLCKGREVELGLEGFDAKEKAWEDEAKRTKAPTQDGMKTGYYNFTPRMVLP